MIEKEGLKRVYGAPPPGRYVIEVDSPSDADEFLEECFHEENVLKMSAREKQTK